MDSAAAYKDPKQEKDLSELADRAVASAETYAAAGEMENATNVILSAEKECRNAVDGASAAKVCVWLLTALFKRNMLKEGCEWILASSKKRSQLKRVQKEMVHEGMKWIDHSWPHRSDVYELIETLCKVTDGKIFLELERARTILRLSKMKEEEGDVEAAADVLQEVQVESNIYMDKVEKGSYIIEQMRLVILKKDWIRCQIISKKLSKKVLDSEGFELLKLKFYSYMCQYYNHLMLTEDSTEAGKNLADCYAACLDTACERLSDEDLQQLQSFIPAAQVSKPADLKLWYLSSLILSLALSEESAEKVTSLKRILLKHEKVLRDHAYLRECAEQLVDEDVTFYAPPACVLTLAEHPLLADDALLVGAEERRSMLRLAYLRHNLVVVAKFYKRSSLELLSKLTGFSSEEVEEQLCKLLLNRNFSAKINRPTGEVLFSERKEDAAINGWSHSICQTLDALSEACNLIEKERYIQLANA